jgi:hypothetical protein
MYDADGDIYGSFWEDDDWDPWAPVLPNDPVYPVDPFNGLSDYFAETLGEDWQSRFTSSELAEISRLSNMPDDDFDALIYNTNDATQTGGFWNDLGNAFSDAFGSVFGNAVRGATTTANNAITGGTTSANNSLSKFFAPNQPAKHTSGNSSLIVIGLAAAAGIALAVYFARRR